MPIAVSQTMAALCAVVQNLPIGTNLVLLHFLWIQLSGALLFNLSSALPMRFYQGNLGFRGPQRSRPGVNRVGLYHVTYSGASRPSEA
jgi:hypothetical protein